MSLKFDLAIIDDVLTLLLFKPEKEPLQPTLYHYPEHFLMRLERSALDKHEMFLTPESNDYLKQYNLIQVIELDPKDNTGDEVISYICEIQTMITDGADEEEVMKINPEYFEKVTPEVKQKSHDTGFSSELLSD